MTIYTVNFEKDSDFEVGIEHQPQHALYGKILSGYPNSPWDRGGYIWAETQEILLIPEIEIVHSGKQSARLQLLNPIDDTRRRVEIYHDWDPINDLDLWMVGWYYLPLDFEVNDWTVLHRILTERLYDPNNMYKEAGGWEGVNWTVDIGSYPGWIVGDQFRLNVGHIANVDNNQDGVKDFTAYGDQLTQGYVRRGEWFKISTYINRDLTNGMVRVLLNDKVIFERIGIRTIGILPQRILDAGYGTGQQKRAWLSNGFSLYTGDLPCTPKSLIIDDVMLANTLEEPTPTPIPPKILTVLGSLAIGTVILGLSLKGK